MQPLRQQKIGECIVTWEPIGGDEIFISSTGPSIPHRLAAQAIVEQQFISTHEPIERSASHHLAATKYADWNDIMAKAKRLIQSGDVQILRNGYHTIVGHVKGDHGDYQTEISRDDPSSQAITLWQCECPWDQFAWQRTRQWKKYEGRVCSHVLATYWLAQSMPLDEEYEPGSSPQAPQGPPGTVAPGASPQPEEFQPNMSPSQAAPGSIAPTPPPGQAPEPPELLPPYQMSPATQPAINPVSVPGQKPQTPLNPVQYPGGTFSSIHIGEQEFTNGMMVSNKYEDVGTTVGLGAGQQKTIPQNSVGEVLGTDPATGMVNVYFAGPQAEAGKLQPHGVTGWFFPQELAIRTDVRPPGPAIRRR